MNKKFNKNCFFFQHAKLKDFLFFHFPDISLTKSNRQKKIALRDCIFLNLWKLN